VKAGQDEITLRKKRLEMQIGLESERASVVMPDNAQTGQADYATYREFSKLLVKVSREGNVFVIGFADPGHVEVHLSGFDNIPLVEQLKIGAGFRCCTGGACQRL
jgi:hypothetical protein